MIRRPFAEGFTDTSRIVGKLDVESGRTEPSGPLTEVSGFGGLRLTGEGGVVEELGVGGYEDRLGGGVEG